MAALMGTSANRTASGAPSATARKKHGDKQGRFPVFDHKSGVNALALRGHDANPAGIIAKVRRWAQAHNDTALLNACTKAAEADRKRK